MAAAVFGGSPRHHNRMMVSSGGGGGGGGGGSSNISNSIANHLAHSNPLAKPILAATLNQSNNIIFPPTSFITSSTPTSASLAAVPSAVSVGGGGSGAISSSMASASHHYHHHSLQHHQHTHRHSKRKSAVELLAESKPFYVKSETVLDRQQQLSYRGNPPAPSCILSPSRTPIPHHRSNTIASNTNNNSISNTSSMNRRSTSSSSDLLQTKLRTLLNAPENNKDSPIPMGDIGLMTKFKPDSPSNYDINKYMSPKKLNQELTVLPDPNSDVSVFFPSAFLSPQSLPPHPVTDDDIFSYGIDETLMLTDDYQTISPPAEYAEDNSMKPSRSGANVRYSGYQRSYSHSQAVPSNEVEDTSTAYNINSHKSLPDLHSQISRHSPHSEALSCCSRGNRSNKSGSSFNRDSGGSSGHYTHRSEPCCKQKEMLNSNVSSGGGGGGINNVTNTNADFRRDSGSSTQHSGNSYYAYGIPPVRYDCMECRAKIQNDANCLLNFTTPEVPEAFQDDYQMMEKSRHRYYEECNAAQQKFYKSQLSPKQKPQEHSSVTQETELSPPLGTFKRQRCFRVKQRGRYSSPSDRNCRSEDDRRPILRSKSDISDRYWHRGGTIQFSEKPILDKRNSGGSGGGGKSESVSQLERFFDRLGLNEETYEEFIAPKIQYSSDTDSDHSSPVFFSDASTVDSNRLPDSTEVNPNTQAYRPSEPPSIVERNARIIKWLCNCRKIQMS